MGRRVTLPEIVMWTVVVGVGLPAAFLNRTALVLSGTWLLAEVVCRKTGTNLPILLYFVLDYLVLLVIFTKPEIRDLSPYRTFFDQMKALWKEHSPNDIVVAGIFPLMWIVYVADIGDHRWWVLWGLVQLQFFAAGWEALSLFRSGRKSVRDANPPGLLRLGLAGHG
jgi:hypothetical protein